VITVVGLSHKTAPIELRERFALPADQVPEFLRRLKKRPEIAEAVLISTCNRVELIAAGPLGVDPADVAVACGKEIAAIAPDQNAKVYALLGKDAVRHLFNVASSLDSLVLGEPQILGQVKAAYDLARGAGTVGARLHRTLSRALRTAKLVRSQTAIGAGQVSVPSVAVELAGQIFGTLSDRVALLVGSGEMAETVARLLQQAGARILVIGRTREKVDALAVAVGGEGRSMSDLTATLAEVDVVITSTSAPGYVIDRDPVARARRSRRGRSQFYIDLAVPRDVDPSIEDLDGVFLYNVDDFSRIVAQSLATRSREAERAQAIIEAEARDFERWVEGEQATPTVVALRRRIRGALRAEVERSLRGRLKHLGEAEREALATMVDAAVNRILHEPTMRLREAATAESADISGLPELAGALERLFSLSDRLDDEPAGDDDTAPSSDPDPALKSKPYALKQSQG
jgi:glutamyl-tRNA reductase